MIQNIIAGRIAESAERRQIEGWDLPKTTSQDTSAALKAMRRSVTSSFAQRLAALKALGSRADWISERDFGPIIARTGTTRKYLVESLGRLHRWLGRIDEYVARLGTVTENGLQAADALYVGGVPTAVVLAGDATALAPLALSHVVLAGANAVVKASSIEPLAPFLFIRALLESGLPAPQLLFLDTSIDDERKFVRELVASASCAVIYGEDGTIDRICDGIPPSAARKVVPYWSGRSTALLLPDADIERAAQLVLFGATDDRGNRCLSTKKVLVPESLASEFEAALVRGADRLRRGPPEDPDTDLGRPDPVAKRLAESAALEGEILYDRDLFLVRASEHSTMFRDEIPYPFLAIRSYAQDEDPVQIANDAVARTRSGLMLALSVIGQNRQHFEEAAARARAFKVLWNLPTTYLDHFNAHQGMHLFRELMRPTAIVREPIR